MSKERYVIRLVFTSAYLGVIFGGLINSNRGCRLL